MLYHTLYASGVVRERIIWTSDARGDGSTIPTAQAVQDNNNIIVNSATTFADCATTLKKKGNMIIIKYNYIFYIVFSRSPVSLFEYARDVIRSFSTAVPPAEPPFCAFRFDF